MFRNHLSKVKVFALLALVLIVAAGASAFAAGITLPSTIAAGQGVSVVKGFTIGDSLQFTWGNGNPAALTTVAFTLTAAEGDPVAAWANVTVDGTTSDCGAPIVSDQDASFVCTLPAPVAAASVGSVTVAAGSSGTVNPEAL